MILTGHWAGNSLEESLLLSYDYVLDTGINLQADQLFQTKEAHPTIGIQKIGTKTRVAIVSLNEPEGDLGIMPYEEITAIYKVIRQRLSPEYINIFTNRGIEIAYDSKPDDLEIIKVPCNLCRIRKIRYGKEKTRDNLLSEYNKLLQRVIDDYCDSCSALNLFSTSDYAVFNNIETGITMHPLRKYQVEALYILDYLLRCSDKRPEKRHLLEELDKDSKTKAPFLSYEMATGSGKNNADGCKVFTSSIRSMASITFLSSRRHLLIFTKRP